MFKYKLDPRVVFPVLFFILSFLALSGGDTQEVLLNNQVPLTCTKNEKTVTSNTCPLSANLKHRVEYPNQADFHGDQLVIGIFVKSRIKEEVIINTNIAEVKINVDGAVFEINKKTKAVVKRKDLNFEVDHRAMLDYRVGTNLSTLATVHTAEINPDVYYAVEIYQIRAFYVRRYLHQYVVDDVLRGAMTPYITFFTSEIKGKSRVEYFRFASFCLVACLSIYWILNTLNSPRKYFKDPYFWLTFILTGISIVYLLPGRLLFLPISDTFRRVFFMTTFNFTLDCFIYGRGLPKPLGEVLIFASFFFHTYYGMTMEQGTRDSYDLDMPGLIQFRDPRPKESQALVKYFHSLKYYPLLISSIYIAFFSKTANQNIKKLMPTLAFILAWISCFDLSDFPFQEREKNPFKLAYEFCFIPWMIGLLQFIVSITKSDSYFGMALSSIQESGN